MRRGEPPAIVVVAGLDEHARDLAPRLRAIDRIECEAMGRSAAQALRHGVIASARVWTALIDDVPQAMFGVVVGSAAEGEAIAWFLGSDRVGEAARCLIGRGPRIIAAMHEHGRVLRNFVSAENRPAIRLLEHWGFAVDADRIAVRGVAFRRFKRENK